jgi:DOPA 4,5-dioxygenase
MTFSSVDFEAFIPWLEAQRHELSVLVNGLTGDNLQDYTEHASWVGDEVELNLELFRT